MAKKREYKKWSQQQYTHGAIWVTIAAAMLNLNDKAFEYYRMINPIEHTRTKEAANIYKVEPYVVAADVYGKANLAGRGGWTWYTGSSSWMFIAGIKYILGINIEGGVLRVEPHVPDSWDGYSVRFHYGDSIYNVKVIKNVEEKKVLLNGEEVKDFAIRLNTNGGIYNVEVYFNNQL